MDWSESEDELDDDGGDDDEDDDENNIEQSILGENADFFEKNQLNDPEINVQNICNFLCLHLFMFFYSIYHFMKLGVGIIDFEFYSWKFNKTLKRRY